MLVRARILKPFEDDRGYLMVGLCKDGLKITKKIHRLVAEHFDLSGYGDTVNHVDMNKKNNRASNLEWATAQDNLQLAWDAGTHCPYKNPKITKKMTASLVADLRRDASSGELSYRALGRKYGLTHKTVRDIVLERSWRL